MTKKIKTKLALILAISLSTTPVLAMETVEKQDEKISSTVEKQDEKISSSESNLTNERFPRCIDGLDNRVTRLPVAGKMTLFNFILTAAYGIGVGLYTWGGCWNAEDTGASMLARTIGIAKSILDFTRLHYELGIPNS